MLLCRFHCEYKIEWTNTWTNVKLKKLKNNQKIKIYYVRILRWARNGWDSNSNYRSSKCFQWKWISRNVGRNWTNSWCKFINCKTNNFTSDFKLWASAGFKIEPDKFWICMTRKENCLYVSTNIIVTVKTFSTVELGINSSFDWFHINALQPAGYKSFVPLYWGLTVSSKSGKGTRKIDCHVFISGFSVLIWYWLYSLTFQLCLTKIFRLF